MGLYEPRNYRRTVRLTNNPATTPHIDFTPFSRGIVFVPAGATSTTLSFYVSARDSATPVPLYSGAAPVVLNIQPNRAYEIPPAAAAAAKLHLVTNQDDSSRDWEVSLSS